MNKKIEKFLLKILLLLPLGFLIQLIAYSFNSWNWFTVIFYSFVLSAGIVFWNWFEYEKFDEISTEDFLESRHTWILTNLDDELQLYLESITSKVKNYSINKNSKNYIEVEIDNNLINSIVSIERLEERVVIKIRRKYLSFLPDCAENFRKHHYLFPNKSYR